MQDPYVWIALALGLLVGSFLNVVILRLPEVMKRGWRTEAREFLGLEAEQEPQRLNLAYPPSACPSCNAAIKPWHNIPVFSYLALRGKCSSCKTPISLQYPLVELLTGVLTAYLIYRFGMTPAGYLAVIFTWCLIAMTGIDFREQLLPDNITLPLLWLGLLANAQGIFTDLNSAVIGAAAGYLSLWSIFWLFKLVTGKEGMGYGDFKLLAALGAWMGWQLLPLVIMLSTLVGAIIGIFGIVMAKRDKNIPMAFGPYLAIAGWIALLWGEQINRAYLGYVLP